MASFFCHGFGVTKQVRLERIVRPQLGWDHVPSKLAIFNGK